MALNIEKFSFGLGDRFAHQAAAQLAAVMKANEAGVEVVPVWNKSNREHQTIGSQPDDARAARHRHKRPAPRPSAQLLNLSHPPRMKMSHRRPTTSL